MQQQTLPAPKRAKNNTKNWHKNCSKQTIIPLTQEQQPMKTVISIILITLLIATVIYAQDSPQWHLPEGTKARLGKGAINEIAYSPDSTKLAAATAIGVWLYDVQTGKELQLLATEPVAVQNIAFSPDSTKLVSSGIGAPISLWNVESGRLLRTFPVESSRSNYGVAYSPDGKIIASHGEIGTVQIWNSDTGENIRTLTGQETWRSLNSITFSPDGKTLATGWLNGTICLWDVNTGTIKHTLTDHEGWVLSLQFFPDGKTLVSGSGAQDHTIRLWDVNTGNLIRTLDEHYDWILDVAVSPHGNILIACDNHYEIRIWNLNTGEVLKRILEYSHAPRSVIFSADGNTFATGGSDTYIYIWDVATAMKIRKFTHHEYISTQAAFSPTENTIATSGGGSALLFDTDTGELKRKLIGHTGYIRTLAYSPDGTILATGSSNDTLQLLDVETGTARLPPIDTPGGYPYSITFSSDGELVACLVDNYATIRLYTYRTASGKRLHTTKVYTNTGQFFGRNQGDLEIEHSRRVNNIAFSPDGTTIASCASDNSIRFWDVENGTHLRKLNTEYSTSNIAFSPDGQTITGMSYGFVHQWNVETGEKLQTIPIPIPRDAHISSDMAFSSHGTMAAMGFMDGTVRLWDVENGTQLRLLKGHTTWIRNVMFSQDGQTLASSSADRTTLLWDITPVIPSPTVVKLSPVKVQSPALGEHLNLSLDITEGQDVAGYQATINYDPTALTYIKSTNGDYLIGGIFNPSQTVGVLSKRAEGDSNPDSSAITLYATAFGEQSNGNGTLATITFEVIAQKTSSVTLSDVLLTDSLGGSTIPQIAGTEILKSFVQPEDVNGDGVVNITDLIFVAANLGNRGANPADVNVDGVVDIVDLALVAAAIGNNGNAAPGRSDLRIETISRATVQSWLNDARQLNLSDPKFLRGVLFLENLLKSLTPKHTALLPNYPNPFNPETWIPYQLASPVDVQIDIYSSDGKLVRHLDLGHQDLGIHQVHWNGNNELGEKVASGIYFYTLTAEDYSATRKMLIRK